MINKIKQKSILNKIQVVEVAKDGIIINSENNLLKMQKNTSIYDIHPAFEAISYYFNEPIGSEFHLSCINISIGKTKGIYDIGLVILENNVFITILDFTKHYQISNTISQEKNEYLIQTQILKEREMFKNMFLANTSHELRSPLSTIMGFITILQRSSLDLSQMHNLNVIKSASEQLKNIIDDILDISTIEIGEFNINRSRFSLKKFLNHINDAYRVKCEAKKLTYIHEIENNLPNFIVGDKYRLGQILNNILDNAIKFTPQGSIILKVNQLETSNDATTIAFEVTDTGIGIENSKIDSIFDTFTKVSEGVPNTGTGLGLSIVKHIVRLKNGSIDVKSEPNKGTTFNITLKFTVSKDQTPLDVITLKQQEEKLNQPKKYSILIAEDIEINQLLIMKILIDYKDYHFDIANNGDQVIELLHKNNYDLILMDLKMPKMDGYDTTRFIRESSLERFKNIPIIAVTASVSKLEKEKCLNCGMNDYIGKPFSEMELIHKIKKLI